MYGTSMTEPLNLEIQKIHSYVLCWQYQGFIEIVLMVLGSLLFSNLSFSMETTKVCRF